MNGSFAGGGVTDAGGHMVVLRGQYDAKCLACHWSGDVARSNATAAKTSIKLCPVSKDNCVSCHMPKVPLPGGHQTFTDHQIRVVKAGEPYPH